MEPQRPQARILVIDDEELVRWSLGTGLVSEGYTVIMAATAEIAAVMADGADLVLVDWHLPGTDGLTLARELRRARPSRPVILMTSYGTPELLKQASAIGVWRVVLKPFDLSEVLPLVRSALQSGADGGGGKR